MPVPFLFASSLHQFIELFGRPRWSLLEFHEASTHFPIGLLLASVLFDFGALIMRKKAWQDVAFWMQMLGTCSLLVTLAAGYFGNPYSGASDQAQKATWHQNFAFATTGLFLLLAVWRISRQRKIGQFEGGIYALATLLAVATISITGWIGAHISG